MELRTLTDGAVIDQLRARTRRERLSRNLSQGDLAERAGLGVHTVRRFEADEGEPALRTFIAILRVLDGLGALDGLLPEPPVDPFNPRVGRDRQRSSRTQQQPSSSWTWGDEK